MIPFGEGLVKKDIWLILFRLFAFDDASSIVKFVVGVLNTALNLMLIIETSLCPAAPDKLNWIKPHCESNPILSLYAPWTESILRGIT